MTLAIETYWKIIFAAGRPVKKKEERSPQMNTKMRRITTEIVDLTYPSPPTFNLEYEIPKDSSVECLNDNANFNPDPPVHKDVQTDLSYPDWYNLIIISNEIVDPEVHFNNDTTLWEFHKSIFGDPLSAGFMSKPPLPKKR